jgi:hypothetical protein
LEKKEFKKFFQKEFMENPKSNPKSKSKNPKPKRKKNENKLMRKSWKSMRVKDDPEASEQLFMDDFMRVCGHILAQNTHEPADVFLPHKRQKSDIR